MSTIDYSQTALWNFCKWSWFERYVNQRQFRYTGQRSDPLCLGSLVHNALDNFVKYGRPSFDEETIAENNPTNETVQLAQVLVEGYLKKYPAERWPVERTEQPLRFPLRTGNALWSCHACGHGGGYSGMDFDQIVPGYDKPLACVVCGVDYTVTVGSKPIYGLAKLDGYFYVPTDTTIESGSGLDGDTITLSRGWWAKEYKTKAHGVDRAKWIREWQTKRQADFQILALQNMLRSRDHRGVQEKFHIAADAPVQGVLVCVLEKPYEHTPQRTCKNKACKGKFDMMLFIPRPEGYACPMCGFVQPLKPYTPTAASLPEFFRITVVRNPEQLEIAKEEIRRTAIEMEDMRRNGMNSRLPNRDACVNNVHRRQCEYFNPHTHGGTTETNPSFVKIDATRYMGVAA